MCGKRSAAYIKKRYASWGSISLFVCALLQHIMVAKQFKPIALDAKQTILLHLAEFIGECAAVDIQIIGKLLAVKWNGKAAAATVR